MLWNRPSRRTRLVTASATALVLVSLTSCSTVADLGGLLGGDDEGESPSQDLQLVDPTWIEGLATGERVVAADGRQITSRYPLVPGAPAFTVEVRTAMAERETAFLTEGEGATLTQESTFLVASDGVLGARITTRTDDTVSATTRWYDAGAGEALPWTALLNDEAAIGQLGARVAEVLSTEHELGSDTLPAGVLTPGAETPASPGPSTEPRLVDPEAAWESAAEHAGSALEDIGFNTEGELVVSLSPGEVGSATKDLQIPVPDSEALLSRFGQGARSAVMEGSASLRLGSSQAPGHTLDCDRVPCVALTFDDGPGPDTELLLDHLDAYSAKATFYVMGQLAEHSPEVVRDTAERGHELGNHTWKHDNLATLGGTAVEDDMARTAKAIEEAAGVDTPTMRPPYGSFNATTQKHLDYPLIMWDVDTLDWKHRDTAKTVESAVSGTRPGSIVLFHDIHRPSVDAVPTILERLHAKGYHFVTVTELFGGTPLEPGVVYNRRD